MYFTLLCPRNHMKYNSCKRGPLQHPKQTRAWQHNIMIGQCYSLGTRELRGTAVISLHATFESTNK